MQIQRGPRGVIRKVANWSEKRGRGKLVGGKGQEIQGAMQGRYVKMHSAGWGEHFLDCITWLVRGSVGRWMGNKIWRKGDVGLNLDSAT